MAKKATKEDLKPGIAVLTETNLKSDYTFDEKNTRAQIDWLVKNGAIGLWARGLAGDMWQLDMDLSKQMFKTYADQAKGRAHVGAGCSSLRIREVIELVNYADTVGCDFAWITPPVQSVPTVEEIYRFFQTVIDNTSLPLALYHTPNPGGLYLAPKLMLSILNMSDRFICMKDSGGDMGHHLEIFRLGMHKKVAYYAVTRILVPGLILGAKGGLVHPDAVPMAVATFNAVKKGDMDKAWKLNLRMNGEALILMPPAGAMNVIPPKPWSKAYSKTKISLLTGVEMGPPASPANPKVSEEELKAIKKHIEDWKPLDPDGPMPTT